MEDFPSQNELIAASALLILSTISPPSSSSSIFGFRDEESIGEAIKIRSCRRSSGSFDSKSSDSSEQSDVSTEAISGRSTEIFDFAPNSDEWKLKVVRKSRSKTQQVSAGWRFCQGEISAMASSGSVSSCLTAATHSSAESSSRSRFSGDRTNTSALRKKAHVGSAHIRRRAERILEMLSGGSFSEMTIRRVLGDSPDTSKALRILLKLEKVKRSGMGGRQNPYIYKIA